MSPQDAVEKYGSQSAAARALGVPRTTLQKRLRTGKTTVVADKAHPAMTNVTYPKFPDKDVPLGEIITRLARASKLKSDRAKAEKWFPVHVNDRKPIGLICFGDPHLGTSTDWHRLNRDVATCVTEPGVYGINIGDTTNNWSGRLMRIYADEDISKKTERRLAEWFLAKAGIPWLVWLMGNHDEWADGSEILRMMNRHKTITLDWSARFELVFPNKARVRVHAAHDFPGHSMWNKTHGPSRAAQMTSDADLYLCGHRHTWGIQQFEMAERGRCPVAVRAGTYKRNDPYAISKGYSEDEHGSSIFVIIDPTADADGRVMAFPNVQQGARVLRALRGGKRRG